ncbi:hypothetical protein C8R46DRAFT_979996 [Mycena filopes]|nr:hypothetical protein C8R46DRAFT_979996 [Mycena filopes]
MADSTTREGEDAKMTIERSEIWYEDGSLVLQAQRTRFRVHWSFISQHSSVFHDMQGLPQPSDANSIDNCPVVELSDTAEEATHLLRALYTPTFFSQRMLALPVISSLIRFARKYDFRDIVHAIIANHLTHEYPATLQEFDVISNVIANHLTHEYPATLQEFDVISNVDGGYKMTRIVNYYGIHFDVIRLARENNITSVLPCAFYRALRKHTEAEIFDGVPRGDGTVATLSPADQRICILGRMMAIRAHTQPDGPYGWLHDSHSRRHCLSTSHCQKERHRIALSLLKSSNRYLTLFSLIQSTQYCASCAASNMEAVKKGREKAWGLLPTYFDLPQWSEINNDL